MGYNSRRQCSGKDNTTSLHRVRLLSVYSHPLGKDEPANGPPSHTANRNRLLQWRLKTGKPFEGTHQKNFIRTKNPGRQKIGSVGGSVLCGFSFVFVLSIGSCLLELFFLLALFLLELFYWLFFVGAFFFFFCNRRCCGLWVSVALMSVG